MAKQKETPKEKLTRLVTEYNGMAGSNATATVIANIRLMRSDINNILVNNPELGPVKLKQFGYYVNDPATSRSIKI